MVQLPARRGGRNIAALDPSREFEDIYDRMGQLMGLAFAEPLALGQVPAPPWSPMADISENDDEYVIEIELPGVKKDDLDIQLVDRELIVTGELKETERGLLRRRTRRVGRFEFRVVLPGDVNGDMVSAELHDGVLTVTVPKAHAAKPHRIEIRG